MLNRLKIKLKEVQHECDEAYKKNKSEIEAIIHNYHGIIIRSRFTIGSDFIKKAKHLSTTAKVDPLTYYHDDIGYNYRLVNVLAAIGVAQLEKLEIFREKKIQIASRYRENLNGIGDIGFQKIKSDVISNEWLFTITTKSMQKLLF